jgi:para-aminobenzoate synthetase component 2
MHGKTSMMHHSGDPLFEGMPNPFEATRYHSLIVEESTLPDCLTITARADSGEIMALRHTNHPVVGVQFHPESILTQHGVKMLKNFIESVPVRV